jgi:hypothetical protein
VHPTTQTATPTPARRQRSLRPPWPIWTGLALVALPALASPNWGIGLFGIAVAAFLVKLLWRPGEIQAILFVLFVQWLQAITPVFIALVEGKSYGEHLGDPAFETATVLSLLSVAILTLGLRLALRKVPPLPPEEGYRLLAALRPSRLFLAWIGLTLVVVAAAIVGRIIPGLAQFLLPLGLWKMAVTLLLFLRWLATGQRGGLALIVLVAEVGVGFLGVFSSFKEALLLLLIAGSGVYAFRKPPTAVLVAAGAVLFATLAFWQAIKVPYRSFLSQGERAQVVVVPVQQRLLWLKMATEQVQRHHFERGLKESLGRLGYTEYFGHCLKHVPENVEHTGGRLWKEAILHPLTPRILFRNKAVINDSDRTNEFSGVRVAGAEEGTSISIGYVGESYVDFGKFGMFVAIFLWGLFIGLCYWLVRRRAPNPLLGTALASSLLLTTVMFLESSNIKMSGALVASTLVTIVLLAVFGRAFWTWLCAGGLRRMAP